MRAAHGDEVKLYELPKEQKVNVVVDSPETKSAIAKNKELVVQQLLDRIGRFDSANQQQDDLTKIDGIGTNVAHQLHQIGIFTYGQISKMTNEDYALLDQLLVDYDGQADRKDWSGQATNLKNN